MADNPLLRDTRDGVATLTFNRPDKLNAMSEPLIERLDAEVAALAIDRSVRVVVLKGAGNRAFIAGADIEAYRGGNLKGFIAYQQRSRRIFDALEALPQPVIAAVHGFALGGGFEIALCADIIVCSEEAQFGLPEGRLGLSPGGGGTQRLIRAAGKHVASELMLAGWRIDGRRAHELGLAAACVPAAELDEAVAARVRSCLKVAPLAQAEMKRLMREGVDASLPAAKSLEQEVLYRLFMTGDGLEGVAAFLEKRTPEFRGE